MGWAARLHYKTNRTVIDPNTPVLVFDSSQGPYVRSPSVVRGKRIRKIHRRIVTAAKLAAQKRKNPTTKDGVI